MTKINLQQTQIALPESIKFTKQEGFPDFSLENAPLYGDIDGDGFYLALLRWYPGYMSAPHFYRTDRICVVISGTWWVNSGDDFDPDNCIATPPGSYVRRVAGTPHYDGVIAGASEPVVIAICGISPVNVGLVDPSKPGWRRV